MKRRMKKIAVLVMSVVMVLVMIGCSSTSEETSKTGAKDNKE